MDYFWHVYNLVLIYSVLGLSLWFFSGQVGYISLMHAGFFGFGAYLNAILVMEYGFWTIVSWLLTSGLVALIAYIISFPLFRTKSDYFVILTLVVQMAFILFLTNAQSLTGGSLGLANIPSWPFAYSVKLSASIFTLIAGFIFCIVHFLRKSQLHTRLVAVRDDEMLTASLGINVAALKSSTFAISAGFAAIMGALYGQYLTFIEPSSFPIDESILMLSIVIVAGSGRVLSVFSSALFIIGMPELLRFFFISPSINGNIREIIFGLMLCLATLIKYGNLTSLFCIGTHGGKRK